MKEKEGNMELARKDIKMAQGLAILTMVSQHLFCRLGTDVLCTPLGYILTRYIHCKVKVDKRLTF